METSTQAAIAFGLTAVFASAAALAEDSGYYGYFSAGQARTDRKTEIDNSIIAAGVAPAALTSSAHVTDTGWKLQAGYRVNEHLAVEGGYANLGKFTYDATATVPAATRHGDIELDGWNVGIVGFFPFSSSVTGFAKLGAFAYNLDFACTGTGIACVNPSRSTHRTAAHYGLGVDWTLSPNWFARAEYEVYGRVGEAFNANGTTGTTRADVTIGSVGVGYRF